MNAVLEELTPTDSALTPIPAEHQIIGLFNACLEFALTTRVFFGKAEALRRLGINGEILAAHAEGGGQTVGVLVKEIGRVADEIAEQVGNLSKSGRALAKEAIATTTSARQLRAYADAWTKGLDGSTSIQVQELYESRVTEMADAFVGIKGSFEKHQSALTELQRSLIFIPALTNLIKIAVAECEGVKEQFYDTTDELSAFKSFIEEHTKEISMRIDVSIRDIDEMLAWSK